MLRFLRECGLGECDIAKLGDSCAQDAHHRHRTSPGNGGVCTEAIGVPRDSGMFRMALHAVAFLDKEKIAVKVDYLKNTFRWSDAEVRIAVCKAPTVMFRSKETLQSKSEFLMAEVGLEPAYIAHRPVMLGLSLEGRLRPRYYVLRFLKGNGLLKYDQSYYQVVVQPEKVFMEKYICPHNETAPRLVEDYAAACRGEVPTNFRFV